MLAVPEADGDGVIEATRELNCDGVSVWLDVFDSVCVRERLSVPLRVVD